MFRADPNPQFTHPVDVMVPVDGGHEKQTFKARFSVIGVDDAAGFDLDTGQGSTDFLRKILVSMEDLADANDQPLPYSDKVRDQLLALPYVRAALTRTYYAAIGKAALGN